MITNKYSELNILITNSHSNNRGDEAAQRSMINTIRKVYPNAKFTVLTASPGGLDLPKDVNVLPFFHFTKKNFLFLAGWVVLRKLGVHLPFLNKVNFLFKGLESIAEADVVFSSPGGPYFGELYRSHEIQHLFHILLAKIFKKSVMVYAPSLGPFESSWRNIFRRYVLNKVDIITLRDNVSIKYLEKLSLTCPLVYLTADSAFQEEIVSSDEIENYLLSNAISKDQTGHNEGILIGVTPTGAEWNFRNCPNALEKQKKYINIFVGAINFLIKRYNATIIFFPQLYGNEDDIPLIKEILNKINQKHKAKILPKGFDSMMQQAFISKMDYFIGNRYHSVIFALKGEVPTLCIAYEHKSIGLMDMFNLSNFVIKIQELKCKNLLNKFDQLVAEKEEIKELIKSRLRQARELSLHNSIYAITFIKHALKPVKFDKTLFLEDLKNQMLKFGEGQLLSTKRQNS